MSTNYYFIDTSAILNNELHICQTACGWCTLLQENGYYSTVREIKQFYDKHRDRLIIIDEYDREIPFPKLLNILKWKGKPRGERIDKLGYCWSSSEFS